jgi:phosphohistidine phosphatase
MEIYLMQHGPSFAKDVDPEESLTPDGEAQIATAARGLHRMGLRFDVIVCSSKKRAWQTAKMVAEQLGFQPEKILRTDLVKPMAAPEESIRFLKEYEAAKAVLIAGHLPSLAEIASMLLTEGSKATIQFERGGIGRIDVDSLPTHQGRLRWYLTPEHLRLIAG